MTPIASNESSRSAVRASTTCATSIWRFRATSSTVITGVSGSGKSTVAFDILFAEGQRRYLESLNAYARQFVEPAGRADVDAVYGIPPTVAIEQRTSRGGRKSTVATLTEVYHFLRLLFVKLGVQHCPDCGVPIDAQSLDSIHAKVMKRYRGRRVSLLAPLVIGRKGYYTELAEWAANRGYAALRVDGKLTPTDAWPRLDRFKVHDIELPVAELEVKPAAGRELADALARAVELGRNMVRVLPAPLGSPRRGRRRRRRAVLDRARVPVVQPQLRAARSALVLVQLALRLVPRVPRHGRRARRLRRRANRRRGRVGRRRCVSLLCVCRPAPQARGARRAVPRRNNRRGHGALGRSRASLLREAEARGARARDRARRDAGARRPARLPRARRAWAISRSIARRRRSRAAKRSASGSRRSSARICAASATSSTSRRSVCTRATTRCCSTTIEKLVAKGNTVVVVEHDEETIRRAQHIVDLGPGAGRNGGEVVVNGSFADLVASERSITGSAARRAAAASAARASRDAQERRSGRRLARARRHRAPQSARARRCAAARAARLRDRRQRQRQEHAAPRRARGQSRAAASLRAAVKPRNSSHLKSMKGWQGIGRVLEVDQTPIGKTPRSCPATYVGIFDEIRKLFAADSRSAPARLRREPVLVQRFGRALRRLRGPRTEEDRDELPARRARRLRALRRASDSTPRRSPSSFAARASATCSMMTVDEARRLLRGAAEDPPSVDAAARRRLGLSRARPAEPDAVGRRGAAREARDGAREGATRKPTGAPVGAHVVRARRADDRPAHRRRREARARAAPARRRRQQRHRHRAQPGRARRSRLDRRSRAPKAATAAAASSRKARRRKSRAAVRTRRARWRNFLPRAATW